MVHSQRESLYIGLVCPSCRAVGPSGTCNFTHLTLLNWMQLMLKKHASNNVTSTKLFVLKLLTSLWGKLRTYQSTPKLLKRLQFILRVRICRLYGRWLSSAWIQEWTVTITPGCSAIQYQTNDIKVPPPLPNLISWGLWEIKWSSQTLL